MLKNLTTRKTNNSKNKLGNTSRRTSSVSKQSFLSSKCSKNPLDKKKSMFPNNNKNSNPSNPRKTVSKMTKNVNEKRRALLTPNNTLSNPRKILGQKSKKSEKTKSTNEPLKELTRRKSLNSTNNSTLREGKKIIRSNTLKSINSINRRKSFNSDISKICNKKKKNQEKIGSGKVKTNSSQIKDNFSISQKDKKSAKSIKSINLKYNNQLNISKIPKSKKEKELEKISKIIEDKENININEIKEEDTISIETTMGKINNNNKNQIENHIKDHQVKNKKEINSKNEILMKNVMDILDKKYEKINVPKSSQNFRKSLNDFNEKQNKKFFQYMYNKKKRYFETKWYMENSKNDYPNQINIHNNQFKNLQTNEDKFQHLKRSFSAILLKDDTNKYYRDKYFSDYVDGNCPNLTKLVKRSKAYSSSSSIDNQLFHSCDFKYELKKPNKFKLYENMKKKYESYRYKNIIDLIDGRLNNIRKEYSSYYENPYYKRNSDSMLNNNKLIFGYSSNTSKNGRDYKVQKLINIITDGIDKFKSQRISNNEEVFKNYLYNSII